LKLPNNFPKRTCQNCDVDFGAKKITLFFQVFEREVLKGKDNDFVECLVYSENRAVVMAGNMVDCCKPDHVNQIVSLYYFSLSRVTSFLAHTRLLY
jgi:hypothetical protein